MQIIFTLIFLISLSALGLEIGFIKILSVAHWHHFAFLIIGQSLLGLAASGTFLAVIREKILKYPMDTFIINVFLFGLASISCVQLLEIIPLNLLSIVWDPRQLFHLFITCLVLSLPFFFAANCIGASFIQYKNHIHKIYLFDLIGAGLGALIIIFLMLIAPVKTCIKILSIILLAAGFVSALSQREKIAKQTRIIVSIIALIHLGSIVFYSNQIRMSQYKGLFKTLLIPKARIQKQYFGPLGDISIVLSPTIPYRHAPGLSLKFNGKVPDQLGLFTNGDSFSPIIVPGQKLDFFNFLPSSLPYHLIPSTKPKILILNPQGGFEILQAQFHKPFSPPLWAVDANHHILELLEQRFKGLVNLHLLDSRSFIKLTEETFDLITLSDLDSGLPVNSKGLGMGSDYRYTTQAFINYLEHLNPDGIFSISRWLRIPPTGSLKLFATAVEALKQINIKDPSLHLVMIRSLEVFVLLIKKNPFSQNQLKLIKKFCDERDFDIAYTFQAQSNSVNRHIILEQPFFYDGAQAILGEFAHQFFLNYKFNLIPATDKRPNFHHFFKWSSFKEVFNLVKKGGISLVDWGYPMLISTLFLSIVIGIVIILLPLFLLKNKNTGSTKEKFLNSSYYLFLGLGFLAIEITFIDQFTFYLGHPLYGIAVVLSSFLIFAGVGSGASAKLRSPIKAILAIVILTSLYNFLLPSIFSQSLHLTQVTKVILSICFLAPLAFFMGMPFPLALLKLAKKRPDFIPWAWGINGLASVVSATLASIIMIHFGHFATIIAAIIFYLLSLASALLLR